MGSSTPTNFDVYLYNSNTQIRMEWTNVNTSGTIHVLRNTTGTPIKADEIKELNWPTNYYTDTSAVSGTTYYYRLQAWAPVLGWSGYSSIDSACIGGNYTDSTSETLALTDVTQDDTWGGDSASETLALTEAETIVQALSDSDTDTVSVLDSVATVSIIPLETDYGYYFGSYNGKVYAESEDHTSDDGNFIDAYWISKDADFADMHIDCLDKFKSLYRIKLWYQDLKINTNVTVSISIDGGATWDSKTKVFGTADLTVKCAEYFFIKTSNKFMFKVESNNDTDKFQWLSLEVFFTVGGDWFTVS